ncbi:hypothetical protein GcC1_161015 [Golovinomyces cichoracearum]|uniref:Uncharacterized protein n=1 Tax=Golovinomyces cichoracearum TaxID=62708 RepID=A0A420HU28_9PEZI|nr:hypothetical protein GcC1_161015 [Golovinomyces cichoracearum]
MVTNQTSLVLKLSAPFVIIKTKGRMSKNLMIKPSKVYWSALMKTFTKYIIRSSRDQFGYAMSIFWRINLFPPHLKSCTSQALSRWD